MNCLNSEIQRPRESCAAGGVIDGLRAAGVSDEALEKFRPVRFASLALALFVLWGCEGGAPQGAPGPAPRAAATFITPYGPPTRPFSPAVRVGTMLYLSGQIGTDAGARGQLVAGGVEAETKQTMENIKDVLEKSGSSMDRVVKCTVMMADMAEWDRMNSVYATYFPRDKPARSAFGTSGLALSARVEIECLATVD